MASFKTFLEQYCAELSGLNTRSLKQFASKLPEVPRLAEPLLLLALEQNRCNYLLKQTAKYPEATAGYNAFLSAFAFSEEQNLHAFLNSLPADSRYKKCYLSWLSEQEKLSRDRNFLALLQAHFQRVLLEKNLSRAEACRIADLNKGNFYAFLKGDCTKLSRKTAVAAYDKLVAYEG